MRRLAVPRRGYFPPCWLSQHVLERHRLEQVAHVRRRRGELRGHARNANSAQLRMLERLAHVVRRDGLAREPARAVADGTARYARVVEDAQPLRARPGQEARFERVAHVAPDAGLQEVREVAVHTLPLHDLGRADRIERRQEVVREERRQEQPLPVGALVHQRQRDVAELQGGPATVEVVAMDSLGYPRVQHRPDHSGLR